MVVHHSGSALLALAVANAVLGPCCSILPGRSQLPEFHPKDDPAPSILPVGSENCVLQD